jgi:hypothetical protein
MGKWSLALIPHPLPLLTALVTDAGPILEDPPLPLRHDAGEGEVDARDLEGLQGRVVLLYSTKSVCQEPLQRSHVWFGPTAPMLEEKTDARFLNPNSSPTFCKTAVLAPSRSSGSVRPEDWHQETLHGSVGRARMGRGSVCQGD